MNDSPNNAGAPPPKPRTAMRQIWASLCASWDTPAVRRGFLGAVLISCGAFTPAFVPAANPLRHGILAPIIGAWESRALLTVLAIAGMILIVDSWLRLRPTPDVSSQSGKSPVTEYATPDQRAVTALWSLPLLPVPPLFSNDAYSYAAQGNMVHLGSDPYAIGPSGAPGPFAEQVDFYWQHTPAPYGPLSLQIQHGVVDLVGHQPFPAAIAMRFPALVAMVIIALSLPIIAKSCGGSPAFALWFGLANPLVIFHVVGGAHNDALMIAGAVAAAAFALRQRFIVALVLVGTAAAIKQPAIILLAPVAALWAAHKRPQMSAPWTSWRTELRYQPRLMGFGVIAAVLSVGAFCVITAATGLGFGWIAALSIPGSVRTPLTPSVIVGVLLELGSKAIGWRQASFVVMDTTRAVFSALGMLSLIWLWLRYGRTAPLWFAGMGLIALASSGPAFHSWYILWGSTFLGCYVLQRRILRWTVWLTAIFAAYSVIDVAFRNGLLALGITGVAFLVWLAVGHDKRLMAQNVAAPHPRGNTPAQAET